MNTKQSPSSFFTRGLRLWTTGISALLLLVFTSGCFENDIEVFVERDGSGRIEMKMLFSPQAMAMMGGNEMLDQMVADATEQMGEGVELTSTERISNDRGWQGVQANYTFTDISNIDLPVDAPDGEEATEQEETPLKFSFESGRPATLIAQLPAQGMYGNDESMDEQSMAMLQSPEMQGMLQGMNMSIRITFADTIRDTNAEYVSNDRKTVTLLQMPLDKLFANPEAMKLMNEGTPEAIEKLKQLNIEGLKLEPQGKKVEVKF